MELRQTTMAGLTVRIATATATPKQALVLCHGFGAPGTDLVSLAPELLRANPRLAEDTAFVFPEAPLTLPEYGPTSRAWWLIDMMRLQMLQRADATVMEARREEVPNGLPESRKKLMALLDALSTQWKLPMGRFVLGGFSQGAMLATDVTVRLEEPPAALVIFSGTLLSRADWRQRAERRRGLRVLMSHGRQDPILPYAEAEHLHTLLTQAGLVVDLVPFDGPHTIPMEAVEKLERLLESVRVTAA